MNPKLLAALIGFIGSLGVGLYFGYSYCDRGWQAKWNAAVIVQQQAVAKAKDAAAKLQASQDAVILKETQSALTLYQSKAQSAAAQLAALQSHTKAVNNVPEVHAWNCTRIPAALLAGLSDNAPVSVSSDCAH